MSGLRAEYQELCNQFELEPEASVEKALKNANTSACLTFQGDTTLSATTCQILAKIISSTHALIKLDFSNCMLPSPGVVDLLCGLKKNKSVRELDMSSNNLQADSALHLGTYLRHNKTLERLFLQWNSLGQSKETFAILSEAIGANQSLQELDLRNNSLTAVSTEDLAFAIKSNKSLKTVDLRWNALGPGDGRSLLHAVQDSPQLTSIQLDGNLFTADMILTIELAASHNADMMQLAREWEARCDILSKHTAQLEKRDGKRSSGVRFLLQQQGQKINTMNKEQRNEMIKAEEQLFVNKKRMETMESLILDREDQIETLQEMNKSLQQDKDMESTELGEQLGLVREQLFSAQTLIQTLKMKIQELEAEKKGLQLENSHLKDSMSLHNTNCEDVIKAAEERAKSAIHKARQEKTEIEEEIKKMQRSYEDKLRKINELRADLETRIQSQNQSHLEALTTLKKNMLDKEEKNLDIWASEKAELQSAVEKCRSKFDSLQKDMQLKTEEAAKMSLTISELQQVVSREQDKNLTLVEKLEDSAYRKREAESLKAQIALVQSELISLREEKDSQIKQLTELLSSQEKHYAELRFGEAQRTGILCSAVTQYITKVGATVGSSENIQ
ncbi:leucine-rich repeat-containing protein 45-like [Cloeon dipterum]|uniref:leucine-rich repeat-containing protein 45-like n=1 Tax=Cloeon dipterum TaxID=197152 RepID=UPI0032202DD0